MLGGMVTQPHVSLETQACGAEARVQSCSDPGLGLSPNCPSHGSAWDPGEGTFTF